MGFFNILDTLTFMTLSIFLLLQHLVRLRWEELSPSERRDFAKVSVDLMSEIASPSEEWSLKSQSAALVAEVGAHIYLNSQKRRPRSLAGVVSFTNLLTYNVLTSYLKNQAEVVSMMLRWLPEDITVHNEDLEGDRRRLLLRGLTQSLPEILPLLYNLLERHFGAAMNEASRQQVDLAKQHAAVVIACLNAINAYAEWAPVLDLSRYGIINGCGALLSSPDFRLHACDFFKLVCSRKRPSDVSGTEFDAAISSLFQSLMNVSREFLYRSASCAAGIDESDYEFAECICESLVSLGSTNLQCIATDGGVLALYLEQDVAVLDSQQLAFDCIVATVFDGFSEFAGGSSDVHFSLRGIFEGLLQQLLSLKLTEPELIKMHGHYLDAMGPFLKYFPDAVGNVISKLFEMLTSLPHIVKDPATSTSRVARLQICTSFIRIAKTADKSVLPHMKSIADTMAYMQREGTLLRGEHNILGEAFLVMASAAGAQQQQEVLAWLLEPLSQQWIQSEWQNCYLSDPMGLVRLCSNTPFMWSLFHTVTFFEKALKRSGHRKSNLNTTSVTSQDLHPMAHHLSWMLPPLLKLLRVIHCLWSPSVYQTLPPEMRAAMTMADVERYSLLGEAIPKFSKVSSVYADGSFDGGKEGQSEANESDVRNWLKGIRDSGYCVLGLSATIGDTFFKCLDANYVAVALMENLQSMEFRHMRQLIHSSVVYVVKSCPADMWETWLEVLLHPLFIHCQKAISSSWASVMREGRAQVPDSFGVQNGPDMKLEVMEEKLLRDLTREIANLLSTMASPGLNPGLPVLEHSGPVGRIDVSSPKDLLAFKSNSMVGFLLNHKNVALPTLQICLEVFTWTDGETTTKVCCFCGVVVLLAILTNNVELREFVSKDLFSAVIRGLAMESNAVNSADLVNLCREIVIYLSDRDPAPRQVSFCLFVYIN
ncbi:hypothetical protein F2Q70_00032254 [Brassica cretica]|uniref:Exportin-1/Importin-beta-like domain-containing protein n=1 Tax=Brassica cretica TaxID=69181 RepID=A0A8S9FHF2_BRACR|nr:hypothetical protein F2Q70_00032254 [Brassica cretica]